MKSKREISLRELERRNPGLTVYSWTTCEGRACGQAWRGSKLLAQRTGRNLGRVHYELSEALLKLNARAGAAAQGWRDERTGKIEPLQADHIQARSKGRLDSKENLALVGRKTHAVRHREQKTTSELNR